MASQASNKSSVPDLREVETKAEKKQDVRYSNSEFFCDDSTPLLKRLRGQLASGAGRRGC